MDQREMTEYKAGDVRDDVPAVSVPWLLERGKIEPYVSEPTEEVT